MRKAPNYKLGEAVDGVWKQELLTYLGKKFNLTTLIETGTCDGGTLGAIYQNFKEIHTIELSEYYYNISSKKFNGIEHIHLYKGNSSVVLRDLLNTINDSPTLFWLDAHSSGGLTADEGDPLPDEIKAIMELRPTGLIVIDDQSDDLLISATSAGIDFTGWIKEFRYGVVFLYREGLYEIPEFTN
jgi:hypothetical protein